MGAFLFMPSRHSFSRANFLYPRSFLWEVGKDETERISQLLDVNFAKYGIDGHWVADVENKVPCEKCGKLSGLDDFVYTSLKKGVHSREFLLKMFLAIEPGRGANHLVDCAECGTTFKQDGEVYLPTRFRSFR